MSPTRSATQEPRSCLRLGSGEQELTSPPLTTRVTASLRRDRGRHMAIRDQLGEIAPLSRRYLRDTRQRRVELICCRFCIWKFRHDRWWMELVGHASNPLFDSAASYNTAASPDTVKETVIG